MPFIQASGKREAWEDSGAYKRFIQKPNPLSPALAAFEPCFYPLFFQSTAPSWWWFIRRKTHPFGAIQVNSIYCGFKIWKVLKGGQMMCIPKGAQSTEWIVLVGLPVDCWLTVWKSVVGTRKYLNSPILEWVWLTSRQPTLICIIRPVSTSINTSINWFPLAWVETVAGEKCYNVMSE